MSELPTHYICIILIFFHSGVKLRTGEIKDVLKSIKGLIWGVVCILFVTPVIGGKLTGSLPYVPMVLPTENSFAAIRNNSINNITKDTDWSTRSHVSNESILGPALFQTAMQIYFIAPCTISAGVILVSFINFTLYCSCLLCFDYALLMMLLISLLLFDPKD